MWNLWHFLLFLYLTEYLWVNRIDLKEVLYWTANLKCVELEMLKKLCEIVKGLLNASRLVIIESTVIELTKNDCDWQNFTLVTYHIDWLPICGYSYSQFKSSRLCWGTIFKTFRRIKQYYIGPPFRGSNNQSGSNCTIDQNLVTWKLLVTFSIRVVKLLLLLSITPMLLATSFITSGVSHQKRKLCLRQKNWLSV